jgi:hypothetical protein
MHGKAQNEAKFNLAKRAVRALAAVQQAKRKNAKLEYIANQ